MGKSIDLYSYDYEKLVNKTLEVCKTNKRELVEQILLAFGNKIADRYILLNQELWDDYSCYYNVARVLNRVFKTEDAFDDIFCTYKDEDCNIEELISARDIDVVLDELDIEYENGRN